MIEYYYILHEWSQNNMIKIQIPATSANLGAGFDALGLALTYYNYVEMEESDKIDISSLDDVEVPVDENNLICSVDIARRIFCQLAVFDIAQIQQLNLFHIG